MRVTVFALATLASLAAVAADAPVPAAVKVLRAEHYVDVKAGRLVSPAVIVVRGNRIRPSISDITGGRDVIELPGRTLMPDDRPTHLTSMGEGWETRDVDWTDADRAGVGTRATR
jgi:hypothetical protein